MKEQIQLLIAQHKLHKEEAVYELNMINNSIKFDEYPSLEKEIEMRTLFICELEQLIS